MAATQSDDLITTTIAIDGMTCGHCVAAVTQELSKLAGVSSVEVDLGHGTATVRSVASLDPGEVAAAVDEAGFEVLA